MTALNVDSLSIVLAWYGIYPIYLILIK